ADQGTSSILISVAVPVLITFDIDDTIRLHGSSQSSEPPAMTWLARLLYREPLRLGFRLLCRDLRALDCRIGIYTTSSRPTGYIRRWMRCYGLTPDLIVNAAVHEAAFAGRHDQARRPSKHPGLFGVDLHIDDSEGVALEAERFGFRALIIDPEDLDWGDTILDAVRSL
ncbi:MAG TPA: hypothetical protein VGE67_10835, partial [Haloferula sp.]